MGKRKRRERRRQHAETRGAAPHDGAPPRRAAVAEAKRQAAYIASTKRLMRMRTIVGALGFVPLTMSLLCLGLLVPAFCAIPREIYLGVWSALFGLFLGLTIRMYRDRRKFQRETARA